MASVQDSRTRGSVRPSLGEAVSTLGDLRKAVFFSQGWLELSRKASWRRNDLGRVQEEASDGMTEGGWGLQGVEPGSHCCGSGVLGRELGGLLEKSEAGGGYARSLRSRVQGTAGHDKYTVVCRA